MRISLEDNEFKQAFLEGRLAIDCLEILLIQNGTENPRRYKLLGSLWVNPDRGVEARLVWERDANYPYNPFSSLMEMQQIQSGEIFPEHHYFSLRAVDTEGREWLHPCVSVKRTELEHAEILTISCDYIQFELETLDKRVLTHFVFHETLDIQMNSVNSSTEPLRNGQRHTTGKTAAKGIIDGFEIDYYPVNADKAGNAYELSAVAKPDIAPPRYFDARLLEAIQFSVAKLAWPIMREVIQDGKQIITLSKSTPFNNGHVQAAVPRRAHPDFYRLIACYYQYACAAAQGDEAPPLSKKISGLFTLKGVWLDTIALLLGVSVESLLNEPVYKKLGAPDGKGISKIQELIEHVASAAVDAELITRATSMLGNMKSSSASDKLYVLVKAGVIDDEDIKAWKSIRHAAAHGGLEVELAKLQILLKRVDRLVTMIYKLAFYLIGYKGIYTNFAARGWPDAQFDAAACKERLDKLAEQPLIA